MATAFAFDSNVSVANVRGAVNFGDGPSGCPGAVSGVVGTAEVGAFEMDRVCLGEMTNAELADASACIINGAKFDGWSPLTLTICSMTSCHASL